MLPRVNELVHSFSKEDAWFADLARFMAILGQEASIDQVVPLGTKGGVHLHAV